MTNHPNRNWRAQACQAAEQFLQKYSFLHEAPLTPGGDGLKNRLREAYLAGFADGREQNRRPKNDPRKI